jgi:3-hydroxyisobutyrate dehydrogenase-like beta-hydroxyacid dehydrogenase
VTRVAVFGLGEAGSAIAAGMAAAGADVVGYDPAPVATPDGVHRVDDPRSAVPRVDAVLAVTAAADAPSALDQALDAIAPGTLFADLSTSPPGTMRELAAIADGAGLLFADVALMSVVPGNGVRTPAVVSGPGADTFVTLLSPLGMPVAAVGPDPGAASTRKLLRSVVMKGVAALLIEAMRAADATGLTEEVWTTIVEQLTAADEALLRRLVAGTEIHAVRRLHEMEATAVLLAELGIEPTMTAATVASLRRVPGEGIPHLPETTSTEEST